MTSGIYKITNLVNGKCYIGQTINFKARFKDHKIRLKNNKHHTYHLQLAYNKYGKEAFKFEVLFYCLADKGVLARFETYFYEMYRHEYNKRIVTESCLGIKHTEEQNKKQSERSKGRLSPNKNIPMLEEQKLKISETKKCKYQSEEHIKNRLKSRKITEDNKKLLKLCQKNSKKFENIPEKIRKISEKIPKKLPEIDKNFEAFAWIFGKYIEW